MNQRPGKQNVDLSEKIAIESDIHIKQEVDDDLYHVVDIPDWCHESSEQLIKSEPTEKPLKKKRKRKKEPQINSKGINFYTIHSGNLIVRLPNHPNHIFMNAYI